MQFPSISLAVALFLTGCATVSPVFQPTHSQTGLLRWDANGRILVGQLVLASDAKGNVELQFSKEAPLLNLRLQTDSEASAEGPLAQGGWHGPVDRSPESFMAGFNFCAAWRDAANLPDGENEVHTLRFRAAYNKVGGVLKSLSVQTEGRNESLTALLSN